MKLIALSYLRIFSIKLSQITGEIWIKPETNLVSGESLIRQLLCGQLSQLCFVETSLIAIHYLYIINIIIEKEDICQADWQTLLEVAWKKVLFNQFHDIPPGTSIPEIFTEANHDWQNAIAFSIELPKPPQAEAIPVVVFNSLNWERSEAVTLSGEQFETNKGSF